MNQKAFRAILAEANLRAAQASWQADPFSTLRGDCVVVSGLPPACKSVAIKLGAEEVVGGLLFAPAEASVPNVPAIKDKRQWAHAFQRTLVEVGLKAYVMQMELVDV